MDQRAARRTRSLWLRPDEGRQGSAQDPGALAGSWRLQIMKLLEPTENQTTVTMATRVKICGITRVEDALAVAHGGADAVGFVFWQRSARYVTAEKATDIIAA